MKCDLCGKEVETVRRVAVDKGYDRLTKMHKKLYACSDCSEKKEKDRKAKGGGK